MDIETKTELVKLITGINETFVAYKTTNDERLKAIEDGNSTAELDVKLKAIDEDIEKLSDSKDAVEAFMLKQQSPVGGDQKDVDIELEVKSFNTMVIADAQARGKSVGMDFTVDSYAEYKSGFLKIAAGNESQCTAEEVKALSAGIDSEGGYLLPASTAGRTVKRLYDQSIMRQIATVETISTPGMKGIVDNDEADAGWVSELGTRSDTGTPNVGKWEIDVEEMYAKPKASQTLLDDAAVDVEGWLANKVADKLARVEGAAFWTGNGVGKPRGLAAYPTLLSNDESRNWGKFQHVVSGLNGGFHATEKMDVLHDIEGKFKDQYLQNAVWVMRREVRTALRKLKEATSDKYLWEPSNQAGKPDMLNGYAARVDQFMPTLATDSLSLAFGDFREAYTILDRVGIRVLRDPFTAKPYVVFYTTKRTGGGALNFDAVKFVKFGT